jgi:hypothetical protein
MFGLFWPYRSERSTPQAAGSIPLSRPSSDAAQTLFLRAESDRLVTSFRAAMTLSSMINGCGIYGLAP